MIRSINNRDSDIESSPDLAETGGKAKADVHIHSKYSDRPSEWFLRRIGAPECFVEPRELYQRMLDRGMDFVTITDHNCIAGALEIAELPNTFISTEVTTYFPETGSKIHCLVLGINEEQFHCIQEIRENIYELREYLVNQDIITSVAHPLFRINDKLSIDEVEKLILMFNRFELLNGTRDGRAADLAGAVLGGLEAEDIARMAEKHRLEPTGPRPWRKSFTGGSDDHSGVYGASAHTVTPRAESVDEFLAHLRRGEHQAAGNSGGSIMLGHCLYHIAYGYYKARFLQGDQGRPNIARALFERLLSRRQPTAELEPIGFGRRIASYAASFLKARELRKLNETERSIVEEVGALFAQKEPQDTDAAAEDRHTFQMACRISHGLGYSFLREFAKHVGEGRLTESLQTLASLAPVAVGFAPYLAAFSAQHKDEEFHRCVAEHFPSAAHLKEVGEKKAWITDTYKDVNGVCKTIKTLARLAESQGKPMTVITCLEETPRDGFELKNFNPVGTFRLPEYELINLCFPPFLEVIEYIERCRFKELIISTPGPLGLAALAAAKLLGLRTTGIYHTDFPQIAGSLTDDHGVEQITWKYMHWFYDQVDRVVAPSEYYRSHLERKGLDIGRISVMGRGIDLNLFNPGKRNEEYWRRQGLKSGFTFVYAGRISPEKNVDLLLKSFLELLKAHPEANLAIIGDGPTVTDYKARFRHPRIVFTGFLEIDDVATALASSEALVFPSTGDTFGNAVLEAQASGLPAIVSDQGGPREIVELEASGIVVDVSQPGALMVAMARLIDDQTLHAEMRRRALRNAARRTWERSLDELWNGEPNDKAKVPTPAPGNGTFNYKLVSVAVDAS